MIVADPSALLSLASGDILETVLEEFEVHTTETVVEEVEETTRYDDRHAVSVVCPVSAVSTTASGVWYRSTNSGYTFITCSTDVCCNMSSATSTSNGDASGARQGRSWRPFESYHSSIRLTNRSSWSGDMVCAGPVLLYRRLAE